MRVGKSLRVLVVTALLVTGIVFTGGMPASAIIYCDTAVNLTNNSQPQNRADIDGMVAVWQDGRNGTCGAWDIWMHNFLTGEDGPVTTADKKQENPRIDGDYIVYQSDQDCTGSPNDTNIYLFDLYSRETTAVSMHAHDQEDPDVSGDVVVWAEYYQYGKADWDIYAFDLSSREETQLCDDSSAQYEPRVSGDLVVWEDTRNGNGDVFGYDLSAGTELEICTDAGSQWDPVVEDGIVAWLDSRDGYDALYVYDTALETESEVCTSTGSMSDLEIGDGVLVWSDNATGDGDVYMYDLATETKTQVTDVEDCDGMPAYSGGILVYNHYMEEDDYPDVFALAMEDICVSYSPIEGATRYETAVEVSEKAFYRGADTVVIATGANWPDALGASALAGVCDAPILLVEPENIPDAVVAEIARLGATDAFVIGGTSAVSDSVVTDLEGLLSGEVVRLGGIDRFETAQIVASETVAANPEWDGTAFVTTGLNFPDALSASPLAAYAGWPIFLSGEDGVSAETQAAMQDIGVTNLLLLGGAGVVPDTVTLQADTERLGGMNRYGTAVAVATYGEDVLGMSWGRFGLATGENFPDALSAGVALGKWGSPILLTPPTYLDSTTAAAIAGHKLIAMEAWFIGGTNAVSADVRAQVEALIP